jgi:AsmA-like C-terminal region
MQTANTRMARGGKPTWLKWVAGAVALVVILVAALLTVAMRRAEPILRGLIVDRLEARFHARVELAAFHVSVLHGLTAEGKGLRIWPPGTAPDAPSGAAPLKPAVPLPPTPPLIQVDSFRFHAPLHYKSGLPIRISMVRITGFTIDIPPHSRLAPAARPTPESFQQPPAPATGILPKFEIDNINCSNGSLILETDKPGRLPLEFAFKTVKLSHVSPDRAVEFDAVMTNPRPKGTVTTKGSFGPWIVEDPGLSPIAGNYRFEHADLSTFRGIAGILSSTGDYQGTLRDMIVDGETHTPDFRLTDFGSPLPLRTHFRAQVDGTNGDTWLEPVDANLGGSHLTAVGQIVGVTFVSTEPARRERPHGHDIDLTVDVNRGRIEDFLRLVTRNGEPILTGALKMKTTLDIPPGAAPVHLRMGLKGRFQLDDAKFASATIQQRIAELSLRGQGRPKEAKHPDNTDVLSTMRGDFAMAAGVVTLPNLIYTVPGAEIDLKGDYNIEGGALNFDGNAKLQATVSQMVGGFVGKLLKPADRFFKHDGAGTEVPIHITGTRQDPHFAVSF